MLPEVAPVGDVRWRASQQRVVDLVQASDSVGLPLVGPAGMPAEVTAVLRKAFLAMAADKDYQAEAERVDLPVGQPIEGSRIAQMIAALASDGRDARGDRGIQPAGGRKIARCWLDALALLVGLYIDPQQFWLNCRRVHPPYG